MGKIKSGEVACKVCGRDCGFDSRICHDAQLTRSYCRGFVQGAREAKTKQGLMCEVEVYGVFAGPYGSGWRDGQKAWVLADIMSLVQSRKEIRA